MVINIENKIKPALNINSLAVSIKQVRQEDIKKASSKINLQKGQKINLSAISPNIKNIKIKLGWQTNCSIDINAEAFLINSQDKIVGDDWFVFYNQDISPDGSVKLKPRNNPKEEIFEIFLSKLNTLVNKIVFVLTINEALEKRQNFSQVANAYIEIKDTQTNTELVRFDLTDYYSNVVSMMVGEIYKKNNQWRFNAIGNGIGDDLLGLCKFYGVEVE